METDVKSPQSVATFKEQLLASLDAVEGMATRLTKQDEEKLGHFRKNMAPIVKRAEEILLEVDAFEKEWGPFLDRIAALDLGMLRAFSGYNKLEHPVERANEIKHSLQMCRQHLMATKNRVAAMTAKDLPGFSPAGAQENVNTCGHEVQRALDKLEEIQRAMSSFEAAQRL